MNKTGAPAAPAAFYPYREVIVQLKEQTALIRYPIETALARQKGEDHRWRLTKVKYVRTRCL